MTRVAKNFRREEFACKHCGRVDVLDQALVDVLQRARDAKGKPLVVVSGYRCCAGNAAVGGIRYSEHLFGRAADVPGNYATASEWESYGAIGIGIRAGRVIHVDVTPGRRPFRFAD